MSSSKYIAQALAQQKDAAAKETGSRAVPSQEQIMGQLGELDKLGQEGAVPMDDAEVQYHLVAVTALVAKKIVLMLSCPYPEVHCRENAVIGP